MKNIIIVDMQKGFICDNNREIISKINTYLKNNEFDNIFFTKCTNNSSSPYTNILNWHGMTNPNDQEIIIEIPNKAQVITKNCYGISQYDIEIFKKLNISQIEICGTDIDACCLAIGFNLFDNNIKPIFLKDLCSTSSKNSNIKDFAFAIIERQFGKDCIM